MTSDFFISVRGRILRGACANGNSPADKMAATCGWNPPDRGTRFYLAPAGGKEYNLRDHLGNTRLTFADKNNNGIVDVTNSAATNEILQETHYYPFGLSYEGPWLMNDAARDDAYKYNGKEWDETMGLYDYGARWYDPAIARWTTIDPLAQTMSSWSPYNHVFNNLILFIDPDGTTPETVKPTGETEEERQAVLTMIRNTLSVEDAQHVQLDADGNIDRDLLNSHSSSSENYAALSDLVNSDQMIEVTTADGFDYVDENGNPGTEGFGDVLPFDEYSSPDPNGDSMSGTTTGEEGSLGKTLFPDMNGKQNSPDGVLRVVVNEGLSEAGRAEIYSHEANGHARLYVITGGDREAASHQPVGMRENNTALERRILISKKETIQHMKNRKQ